MDEFSSLHICLIGTFAHVDISFCDCLKKALASYHSPFSTGQKTSVDKLLKATFGILSIERHFRALKSSDMYRFLGLLCRSGSVAMMKIFVDIDFDVDGVDIGYDLLRWAAASGNKGVACMLVEAGANGSLALSTFLGYSENLSDAHFKFFLKSLLDNARPTSVRPNSFYDLAQDALLAIISSRRALYFYPEAPKILLDRKVYNNRCL